MPFNEGMDDFPSILALLTKSSQPAGCVHASGFSTEWPVPLTPSISVGEDFC